MRKSLSSFIFSFVIEFPCPSIYGCRRERSCWNYIFHHDCFDCSHADWVGERKERPCVVQKADAMGPSCTVSLRKAKCRIGSSVVQETRSMGPYFTMSMYRPRVVQKERAMGAPTGMPMSRELYLDLMSCNLEKMLLYFDK